MDRYNPDDQRNLKVLVDKWQEESPDDLFHFQLSIKDGSSKQSMLFAHQTPFQQQLLLKYGSEFVLMDSTYKLTRYDCPLFLLVVQGNVGYFVVGLFMVEKETTVEIAAGHKVIKSWNDKWVPKSFITDFDYREINALESVFSGCNVYLCDFHREQSWTRWLRHGLHKNYMDEVLPLLRQIAYSKTENSCNDCIHKLQTLKVYQENADLRNYIQNIWLNEKKRWVHYYRQQCSNMTVNTTNGVESQHKLLKSLYLKKMSTGRSLSAAMEVIVKEFIPDGKDKPTRTISTYGK